MDREDERVVRCLSKLELCMEKRMKLLKSMRKGYFRLGKARSEGRFGQISTNRLPSELRATTRVKDSGRFEIVKGASDEFEKDDEMETSKQETKEMETSKQETSGLRRRRGEKKEKEKMKESPPLDKSSQDDVDIINWFGLYAPKSLRKAQKEFIKSVNIAIEVANINREIERELDAIVCSEDFAEESSK
eukprot:g7037.t1